MDELLQEIRALASYMTRDESIIHHWNATGLHEWICMFCLGTLPVKYTPLPVDGTISTAYIPSIEPCDAATFPHKESCEVLRARRILDLLRLRTITEFSAFVGANALELEQRMAEIEQKNTDFQ